MSFEEKRAWIFLLVAIGGYATYLGVILGRADAGPVTEVVWPIRMSACAGKPTAIQLSAAAATAIGRASAGHGTFVYFINGTPKVETGGPLAIASATCSAWPGSAGAQLEIPPE